VTFSVNSWIISFLNSFCFFFYPVHPVNPVSFFGER
jgi:hypothetical protein